VGPTASLDVVAENKLPPLKCDILKVLTGLSLVLKQMQVLFKLYVIKMHLKYFRCILIT